MATIIRRNSSSEIRNTPAAHEQKQTNALDRVDDLMKAWGSGLLDKPDTFAATTDLFFTKDLIFDVSTANSHVEVPEFKEYSFETLKEWFDWTKGFDITDLVSNAVVSSKNASEVWQMVSCTITNKETGRQATSDQLNIYTLEADKVKSVTVIFSDASKYAYLTGLTETFNGVQRERAAFEPHPEPKLVFDKIFALWAAGEFASESPAQQEMLDKFVHSDFVVDASNTALPDTFGVFHGHKGCDEWANKLLGQWEFERMESSVVAGLRAGQVLQRIECDVKIKGREAKGIIMFNDVAYDSDGKGVAQKVYWANPQVVADLYAGGGDLAFGHKFTQP